MSKPPSLDHVRNIGIVAHVDAGKTTLTERVLFYSGASYKIGEVHDGAAHMDYMAEEQAHGITITSAVTKAPWNDHLIQLVDTPGHVDFTIEVERSMRVLDGCVVVLDGVRGVEPQTETVWRQRSRFELPCLIFVNKMDRVGADYDASLNSLRKRLGAEPAPVTVPGPDDDSIIHLIDGTLLRFTGERGETVVSEPCPQAAWEAVGGHRETLLLAAAESDEALADAVLEGRQPEASQVWDALRKSTLAARCFPCFAGSALRNRGVQPLLDAVIRLLPAPLDRPPARARVPGGADELVSMDAQGDLCALAFKVQLWEGRRHVFARIYRGSLAAGEPVVIAAENGEHRREQVARVFDVDANHKNRIERAFAGQIVLLAGLRFATTGDTLCAPDHPLLLERIESREPVIALAVEPGSSEEEEKFLEVMDKIQQEDPTLRLEEDPETGQRLLRGMGELHLQIVFERLEREFNLRVRAGKPMVALRESVNSRAMGDSLFERHFEDGRRNVDLKARVQVEVNPQERGSGQRIDFQARVLPEGNSLTEDQSTAVQNGARDMLNGGPLEGAPVVDVAIRILEVEVFGAQSSPDALRAAASRATRKALMTGGGFLLHPIMDTEVVVPEENMGQVLGDLQARHGLVRDTENDRGSATIRCEAPLDELLGYTTDLRSMTQGRGQFTMQFNRFDRKG